MKPTDFPSNKVVKPEIFGPRAEVWGWAAADSRSHILDYATMHDTSKLSHSTISRFAEMYGRSQAYDSYLMGNSRMSGESTAIDSVIAEMAELMDRAYVLNCIICGLARVADKATVFNSVVEGNVTIRGDAIVDCVHVGANNEQLMIHEGEWIGVLPLVLGSPDQRYQIQTCIPGRVIIGCLCGTIDEWLRKGAKRLASRRFGVSDENIEAYLEILRNIK
jgi:hypothetical protein